MKTIVIMLVSVAVVALGVWWYCYIYSDAIAQPVQEAETFTAFRDGTVHTDTTTQRILLIGDSMAYSLMFRAQNYCNTNGHHLDVVTWVSATSKTYAMCDTLEYFVEKFRPTYIIFVIGANELFAYDAMSRSKYFDILIPQTHGIPTVWIGPPNWKEDTGINNVMMNMFGARQFFLSKNLKFTRMKGDVAHPDRASGTMWMDSIASWIQRDSYFPIKMKRPEVNNPIHVDFVKLVLH